MIMIIASVIVSSPSSGKSLASQPASLPNCVYSSAYVPKTAWIRGKEGEEEEKAFKRKEKRRKITS